VGRVQFTANLGQEWMGTRATAQWRDFQVSKKGGLLVEVDKGGEEKGVSEKGLRACASMYILC
jgi:hypothetical protein